MQWPADRCPSCVSPPDQECLAQKLGHQRLCVLAAEGVQEYVDLISGVSAPPFDATGSRLEHSLRQWFAEAQQMFRHDRDVKLGLAVPTSGRCCGQS